jgi:hypothetical protein
MEHATTPPNYTGLGCAAVRPLANSYALNRFMQADDPDFLRLSTKLKGF